ncbi:helix-turn-helix domain-containing protein, partial [Solidesulfovibrio sp.]
PGNVRELKNVVERASVLAGDAAVGPEHLPGFFGADREGAAQGEGNRDLDGLVAGYEKSLIEAALSRTGGVQSRAATMLGIKERSLWHRVKKLGIDPGAFKETGGK